MALQPVTQGFEPPPRFGDLLAATAQQTSHPALLSAQIAEAFAGYEKVLRKAENLTGQFETVVEFARQAGQDDETARAFDQWTETYGPAGFFDACEKTLAPGLKRYAANFNKHVEGWQRIAAAGVIGPELPMQLVERITQLDARIRELTPLVTRREDNELIARLLTRVGRHRPLSPAEKIRLSDAIRRRVQVRSTPSERRSDWYGDDGR